MVVNWLKDLCIYPVTYLRLFADTVTSSKESNKPKQPWCATAMLRSAHTSHRCMCTPQKHIDPEQRWMTWVKWLKNPSVQGRWKAPIQHDGEDKTSTFWTLQEVPEIQCWSVPSRQSNRSALTVRRVLIQSTLHGITGRTGERLERNSCVKPRVSLGAALWHVMFQATPVAHKSRPC